jgi:hypothetical protein
MMILVVVDHFTKMAHFVPIKKQHSPTVAREYLENGWKYNGSQDDAVFDPDRTFTRQFFTDLYDYHGIHKRRSTACHMESDC